jgi:UDP-N-acetylglucosamine/UDP-N-acetylgalactosamine 4-epimerase
MQHLDESLEDLSASTPKRWLVTGVCGFIGSHLLEHLLRANQFVVGLDNLSTGTMTNIDRVRIAVGDQRMNNFSLLTGDICDRDLCLRAVKGVDFVLHQAALGSVPRSIHSPSECVRANVLGFVTLVEAARDQGVSRLVYASSSSVYGSSNEGWPLLTGPQPKEEGNEGTLQSPYAVSKQTDETFAEIFAQIYDITFIGLRYFNVFGPRQDSSGPYAAVIPRWIDTLVKGQSCVVYGDGAVSRDFCYVENIVQANIKAALAERARFQGGHVVFNVGCGETTTLLDLFQYLQEEIVRQRPDLPILPLEFREPRQGDVPYSCASIEKISKILRYTSPIDMREGLRRTVTWYLQSLKCADPTSVLLEKC